MLHSLHSIDLDTLDRVVGGTRNSGPEEVPWTDMDYAIQNRMIRPAPRPQQGPPMPRTLPQAPKMLPGDTRAIV